MTYRPPQFRVDDRDVLLPLLRQFPFAALMSVNEGEIELTQLPMLVKQYGDVVVLEGHIARANPHWRPGTRPGVALFQIASHYISPTWYPSKVRDPRTVPTYDYVTVEARGRLDFIHDAEWLEGFVRRLTDVEERRVGGRWTVDEAPREYIEAQLKAIVGVTLSVESLTGTFKLNQHHPRENQEGILQGLTRLQTPGAAALAPFVHPPRADGQK